MICKRATRNEATQVDDGGNSVCALCWLPTHTQLNISGIYGAVALWPPYRIHKNKHNKHRAEYCTQVRYDTEYTQ
jgi:hypothetical protein